MSDYRYGLPSAEDIQAHEARGGWWMSYVPSGGHPLSDYNELGVVKLRVRNCVVQELRFIQGEAACLYRPVLRDGTPCPWPDKVTP